MQHIDAVCAYLKHLLVGVDLILGLLPQLHLVLDTFAESREWVLVIEIRLLPERPQERPLPLLPLILPVLVVDEFECPLRYACLQLLGCDLAEPCDQMVPRLLLVDIHDLLKDVNDALEVGLGDAQEVVRLTQLQEGEVLLVHLVVRVLEGEALVPLIDRVFLLQVEGGHVEDWLVIKE